ncbi:MAG: hypothetical protein QM753_05280 [Thermomicrobiales bacterium]
MGITRRAFMAGGLGGASHLAGGRDLTFKRSETVATGGAGDGLHLTLAGPTSGVTTLDPALVRDNVTMTILRQLFRGLMAFDTDLSLLPRSSRGR